jgi:hypothetical protein
MHKFKDLNINKDRGYTTVFDYFISKYNNVSRFTFNGCTYNISNFTSKSEVFKAILIYHIRYPCYSDKLDYYDIDGRVYSICYDISELLYMFNVLELIKNDYTYHCLFTQVSDKLSLIKIITELNNYKSLGDFSMLADKISRYEIIQHSIELNLKSEI